MPGLNSLDLDLVVVFGTVVGTALVARWTRLPITALEILAGIGLASIFAFSLPAGTDSLLAFGSLLIVFLAGLETNFGFLRAHLREAFTIGLGGFLVPFAGLFALLYFGAHASLLISLIGATALADTSISIVYTTLQQYELADLPFGRLILAATLAVNLTEDLTITSTTFLTTPGVLFTLGVLGALALAAVFLPRLSKAVGAASTKAGYSNVSARSLFFSLAVLALLSSLVGVPGILFVFLMGLLFSEFARERFVTNIRQIAFAIFVPLYFLAVGLKVQLPFVQSHLLLLLAIVGAATALKVAAVYPAARTLLGPERAAPVSVLMNTRLTSATVILTLTLGLGLLTPAWYSLFISVVVILALASVVVLRAFPAFQSTTSARALFSGELPLAADGGETSARAPH